MTFTYIDACPTPVSSYCEPSTCDIPEFFTLGAINNGVPIGNVTYNSGSGHLHLSTASSYTAILFTLRNGVLADYSDGTTIYVQSGSPGLMYDGASDPSGNGPIACSMNCDQTICCYNAALNGVSVGLYCSGDTDDHFYFATANQIASNGCEALSLYVVAS